MIEFENLGKLNKLFFNNYKKSFNDTLKSGWFILGKNVEKFEKEFAEYCGVKYCVGVANGLDALILALRVCDFSKNSEVIVPSNTYIATILSIIHAGLKPVLVEPDIKTYNIDPYKIEDKINKNTKAVMVVHLYGKSANMDPILELCKKYNLKLIEDCAQSHGAKYKDKKTGTFGNINAFSFYPTKNLGALGDAGAVVTDDENLYDKMFTIRNYGSKKKYYNDIAGFNSRLDEVQAGFLSIKLKSLDKINEHKRKLAIIYFENLKNDFILPVVEKDYFDVYHIFNLRNKKRDELKEYLLKNNIKTDIHYPVSPHKQKAMHGIIEGNYPISDEIHQTTLSLPISFYHSEKDILEVCRVLNNFNK